MTQVIVELDDALARRLDEAAPARSRQRSGFIRAAIRRALDELREDQMARAYREQPQEGLEVDLDPRTWEAAHWTPPKKRRGR